MASRSRLTRTLAAAAMTGLVAGAATANLGCKSSNASTQPGMSAGAGDAVLVKHDCKGMNACKGQGGCKTDSNTCKGKNDCRGKGGCNTNKPM